MHEFFISKILIEIQLFISLFNSIWKEKEEKQFSYLKGKEMIKGKTKKGSFLAIFIEILKF
jgi:hypothetical protein